jgi:two-component system CheB/CheR fusion protein
MAFIIIQHLDPEQKSHMAELLARQTAMRVVEAEQNLPVEPDRVYTIPPGAFLTLREGRLHLEKPALGHAVRMPIDLLFRSLAEDMGEAAVGIVLSGTGSDGTLGVRAIRGAGGLVLAQDPASAEFDAMPQSAIATGLVDYVLPPAEMARALLSFVRRVHTGDEEVGSVVEEDAEQALRDILALLLRQTKSDFGGYKRGTLLRRVQRRMSIGQVATPADYLQRLREDPEEVSRLAKDMLIGVTGFFRDTEAFEELRQKAIAPLVRAKEGGAPVRVWVPGCATGEEAYSIAMLLFEEMAAASRHASVQVFASDVEEEALAFARSGVYPASIAEDVPADLLERFFAKVEGGYRITQQLREAVVFTTQNLLTAPPFSNLDLVSCRNVLIYFAAEAQDKVLSLFTFALHEGGYLFLGKSDSILGYTEFFQAVSRKGRLYRRSGVPHHALGRFEVRPGAAPTLSMREQMPHGQQQALLSLPPQILLDHFGASLVLIDAGGDIVSFYGQSERYLVHPTGRADLNLFSMARPRLSGRLRVGVRQALERKATVRLARVPLVAEGGSRRVDVTITPYLPIGGAEPLLAIIFQEVSKVEAGATPSAAGEAGDNAALVEQLEAELRSSRAEMLAATVEFETSNEQLRAIHEEAVSVNEELQSTNEELEASKEELQSLNEELTTVNTQLGEKMEELAATNNDLLNLFGATEIATIFLDKELRIRRFTPAAEALLNLIASDVGRPIGHLSPNFTGADLAASAEVVRRNLSVAEQEVVGRDGHWYTMRAFPYRTVDDRIEGVVVTLADVTRLKHIEEALERERDFTAAVLATEGALVVVLDAEGRMVRFNRACERLTGYTFDEVDGRTVWDLFLLPEERPAVQDTFAKLRRGQFPNEHENHWVAKDGSRHLIRWSNTALTTADGAVEHVIATGLDITERRQAEQVLERYQLLSQDARDIILFVGLDGRILDANGAAERAYGYDREELLSRRVLDLRAPGLRGEVAEQMAAADRGGVLFETIHQRRDGSTFPVEVSSRGAEIAGERVLLSIIRDIAERRRAEEDIRRNEARLESLLRISQHGVGSTEELLDFALDEAIALTGSKIGYVYHYDEGKKEFTLNSWSKDVMQQCTIREQQTVYQLEKTGIWGEAVRQARPIMVNDFHGPHALKKGYPEGHAPLHRYLTVPVFSGDRIVGVVGVANKDTDYDSTDVRQLVLLMDAAWKITEHKRAEEERERLHQEIEQQRVLLATTLAHLSSGVAYLDPAFTFLQCNDQYTAAAGYSREELIGRTIADVFPDEDLLAKFERVRETGRAGLFTEMPFIFPGQPERGTTYWDWALVPVKGDEGVPVGFVLSCVEVTEKMQQRERLVDVERARAELAETLNSEIAHRVKNNLTMIAGLLQMQIAEQPDAEISAVLRSTAGRLLAVASVHEQMQTVGEGDLDLLNVVRHIASANREAFSQKRVIVSVDGEPVLLPHKAATNLAVVTNELITNAIKHGAPGADGEMRVDVGLRRTDGNLRLSVWSSGNPVSPNFDASRQRSMGLRLVWGVSVEQYGGTFCLRAHDGGTIAEAVLDEARLR